MKNDPMTEAEMAEEARRWAEGEMPSEPLVNAPDAVPRAKESVAISLRLPAKMLTVLKEFARRADVGYQVLMKRWLDERIREEREQLRGVRRPIVRVGPEIQYQAAAFNPHLASRLSESAVKDETLRLAEKIAAKE
jgi:hypothetical protein